MGAWFCWLTPCDCPVCCPKDGRPAAPSLLSAAFTTTRLQSDCPVSQSSLPDANAMWPRSALHLFLSCQGHIYSALSVWSGCTHPGAQCPSSGSPVVVSKPSQALKVINDLFQWWLCKRFPMLEQTSDIMRKRGKMSLKRVIKLHF